MSRKEDPYRQRVAELMFPKDGSTPLSREDALIEAVKVPPSIEAMTKNELEEFLERNSIPVLAGSGSGGKTLKADLLRSYKAHKAGV